MKFKNLIFLLSFILVSGCSNPTEQQVSNVQISFKNNSNYQLDNMIVADKTIGNLSSQSSSKYFSFDSFTFDTGMPDEDASAEVNGIVISNHFRGYWCGTEKITIDKGIYTIEIEVADTVLFLSCDNAPRINYSNDN